MVLNLNHRRFWLRIVASVAAVAAAIAVRAWLLGSLWTRAPFVTFYPAVIVASFYGGLAGGLLATALSALVVSVAWTEPMGHFSIRDPADWAAMTIFVMSCMAISWLAQAMQRASARATAAEAEIALAAERNQVQALHQYKLMAEHSRDAILYIRRDDGRILQANAAATQVYGYTAGEFQTLHIEQLRGAEAMQLTEAQMTEADAQGIMFDTVHRRKDGSTFPAEVNSQGTTVAGMRALVSVIRDITNRRQAEQALRDSESRLRLLGDNLPEGALYRYREDADGRRHVDFISAGIERLTGATAAEYMRDTGAIDRALPPEDRERWNAAGEVSRTQLTQFELEVRHRHRVTGEMRWSLLRSTPSPNSDGSTTWDGIVLDITERKRNEEALKASEEALRESEGRYRRLVELAPQALLVQQDGQIVYCNEAAARLYGAESPAKLLGAAMLDLVHAADQVVVRERMQEAEKGTRLPVRELRHLRLDGTEIAVEATAGPVEWRGRRAILAFVADITERKRAEARLRDAQKLESLGLLAGGVAHDFNNLLVGVVGNASLAQDMLPPEHPVTDLLHRVLKTGEQAAHLTRQMLAYSGKGRFVVEPIDLSALIHEMSGLLRPSIAKKIALKLELAPELPAIEADRGQLQQVFMNLALNAAEAIGSREGSITVRTMVREVGEPEKQVHPETAGLTPGKYVCLEVSDTGCGMDETVKTKIFDPFFSTKFTGRGLGLAAVAGIVRGHQGAIAVTSTPGEGTCFTVFFPAGARPAQGSPAAKSNVAPRGGGTILVVDDEPMVRDMVKASLERRGYTVLMASGGLAAIEVFRTHPGEIALVILDLSMPDMSGDETLPELRKIRPEFRVLVSSGYSEFEAMTLFSGQRVSDFIQKPYTSRAIAEKVRLCLA